MCGYLLYCFNFGKDAFFSIIYNSDYNVYHAYIVWLSDELETFRNVSGFYSSFANMWIVMWNSTLGLNLVNVHTNSPNNVKKSIFFTIGEILIEWDINPLSSRSKCSTYLGYIQLISPELLETSIDLKPSNFIYWYTYLCFCYRHLHVVM